MKKEIGIRKFGYQAILLQWRANEVQGKVMATVAFLKKKYSDEVLELVPTYCELAVYLHLHIDRDSFLKKLEAELPFSGKDEQKATPVIYEVPVCYSTEMGMDLQALARAKIIQPKELVELHTAPEYAIHFIGFLPGFPYLSGLDDRLHHPRLADPRSKIPKGSVGIAGAQTGIYPAESPGGWNIIGRTPISLFSVDGDPPATLQAGNYLRFVSIDTEKYWEIENAVKKGTYKIKKSHG